MDSCRTPLEAYGHLLSSRMPRCNRRHNEQQVFLVQYQTWLPLLKELGRKPCTVCRTWTRYTSCSKGVIRVHLSPRIRISPSTMCRGTPIPHHRIILRQRWRSSVLREYSRSWMSRHCSMSSITTLERINSKRFPETSTCDPRSDRTSNRW